MIVTGIKMFFVPDKKIDIQNNALLKWMRKYFRITKEIKDEKFFMLKNDSNTNKVHFFITPLFVALIFIELTKKEKNPKVLIS